jgi:3-oxoacyl-[acyl-carrier-protein] synthase-3
LADQLGCSASWIQRNVGVHRRHVSAPGDDPAVLAATAARPIVESHGAPDLLLYASATVRQLLPDTAVFVGRELGLSGVPCFSVHATCLSFLVALQQATLLIQAGQHKKVLITSAEFATQSRNFQHAESAALFGDGAAAVLVEATDRDAGMLRGQMQTWPEFAELAQIRGGGLLRHPEFETTVESDHRFDMDGESLLRVTMPKLKDFVQSFLEDTECTISNLDWIVPHQASAAGMKLLQRLRLPPQKTVNILGDYGNCVAASMPMALAIANQQDKLKQGNHILLLGSASGLSLGAILWRW